MAHSVVRDQKRLLPCAVHLDGEYGLKDLYMGVPCILGSQGVERIIELELRDAERESLHRSGEAIHKDLDLLREKGLLSA